MKIDYDYFEGFNMGISVIRDWLTQHAYRFDDDFVNEDGKVEKKIDYFELLEQLKPYTIDEIKNHWLVKERFEKNDNSN